MGDTKKLRKTYARPKKLWSVAKLDEERKLMKLYGLGSKKELWRAQAMLRNKRQNARRMLAQSAEERSKKQRLLIQSLAKYGILKENAILDDVLSLNVESVLERRLQTRVWREGLSSTTPQARQFIVHGHIAVKGKKVTAPGYWVTSSEEGKIAYHKKPIPFQTKKSGKERKTVEEKKLDESVVEQIIGEPVEIVEKELKKEIEEQQAVEEAIEREKTE